MQLALRRAVPATLALDTIAPLALALFGSWILATFSLARYDAFLAGKLDLDIQGQVVWNTAHGQPYASTVLQENEVYLAEHLAFSVPLVAVVTSVLPGNRTLLVVQALALGAVSVVVFLYARERLRSDLLALVFQAAFLAMPLVAAIALADFHFLALAAVPLAFGAYLIFTRRTTPGLAILALGVLAEAEVAVYALGLGVWLAFHGARRLGLATAVVAALYALLATQVIMPSFQTTYLQGVNREGGQNRTLSEYSAIREDPSAILRRLRPDRLQDAYTWLLLPSGGLALLAPATLGPAVPMFGALAFQDKERGDRYKDVHAALLLPFLTFAAVDGLRRLQRLPLAAGVVGIGLLVAGAVFSYLTYSPLPAGGGFDAADYQADARGPAIARALSLVPPRVPVLVSGSLIAYLNQRPEVYVFPPGYYREGVASRSGQARFAVLDLRDSPTTNVVDANAGPFRRNTAPVLYAPERRLLVLMDQPPVPGHPAAEPASFDGRLRLLGYDLARRDGRLILTLYWSVDEELSFNYERMVDTLDADGAILSSTTRFTLQAAVPLNDLRPGQHLIDELDLGDASAAPPARVRVGWRQPSKNPRPLRLADERTGYEITLPSLDG